MASENRPIFDRILKRAKAAREAAKKVAVPGDVLFEKKEEKHRLEVYACFEDDGPVREASRPPDNDRHARLCDGSRRNGHRARYGTKTARHKTRYRGHVRG